MSKKKFGSLDSVFETSKVSASMVVKKYQSNYDYSEINENDREKLVISEEDIIISTSEINKGYFKIAKNLYEANQILASYDNTSGKFISWFEGLGLKKTFVYNSIKRYELFLLTNNEEKVNNLSQKAVELIGSKKVDDTLKVEILNEEGIEKKSDRDLREYISKIISEHSEMDKVEEIEVILSFDKFEKEFLEIEDRFKNLKEQFKNGGSKIDLEKIKKINNLLKQI
ncbi:MAG: hypothetical protein JW924_06015 [Fusobacteriaceae bacterium]|nr:hypothetical protein [Fusobacteriaceae bacterium]